MKNNIVRRIISFIFAIWMVMAVPLTAFCEPETQDEKTEITAQEENSEETEEAEEEEKELETDSQGRPILKEGETGILIERKTGTVVYESDSQKRMYPASTTKIMTALIAVEEIDKGNISLEETVQVTAQMLEGLDPDGSNMALKADEILSMKDLLRGLMIPSGNDAAMAIAYKISGSVEAFVERMNTRAAELGLNDTHFMNPHGLHNENHYTTAADMGKLACVAMKNAIFRDIVDIAHVKIAPTNKTEKQRYYINTNGLLSAMRYTEYFYKGSIGIKTGRTSEAGNCLVSAVAREGLEFVGVLFGGKEIKDSHGETIRMMDYGFENYEIRQPISQGDILGEVKVKQGKSKDSVTLSAVTPVQVVVPKGTDPQELTLSLNLPEKVYAPIVKGQEIGTISVMRNGEELGVGKLCADVDVERTIFWPVLALGEWLWSFMLVRLLTYILIAAAVFFGTLMVIGFRRELQKSKRRKRK